MTEPLLLTVRTLHAGYGRKQILSGLSVDVCPGEVLAILGDNGTGKSTLLRAIAGLIRPSSGEIRIGETNVTFWSARRRHTLGIGVLMQGGRIFPNLTVLQNFQLARVNRPRTALDLDRPLGSVFPALAEVAHQRAGLLSGGQRQMLSFEMAALQCGVIGLWDEPTAGLSPENARRAIDYIASLSGPTRAHIIVEQRQELLGQAVNRVLWMDSLALGETSCANI